MVPSRTTHIFRDIHRRSLKPRYKSSFKNVSKWPDDNRRIFEESHSSSRTIAYWACSWLCTLHQTSTEKALKAIKQSEWTRYDYLQIRRIVGHKKDKNPITQVTTLDRDSRDLILFTNRDALEDAKLQWNQQHARRALATPFASNNTLKESIDLNSPNNQKDSILLGTYIETNPSIPLSDIEKEWVQDLKLKITNTIDINITTDDFISFFKGCKERTSLSGCHLGQHKTSAIAGQQGNTKYTETITTLLNISILRPLHSKDGRTVHKSCWTKAKVTLLSTFGSFNYAKLILTSPFTSMGKLTYT